MGLLKINGTIDLKQFWPNGGSDADTAKIEITLNKNNPITFNGKPTNFLIGAQVKGKTNSYTKVISKKSTVTIRYQGIDAPELHYNLIGYKPSLPVGHRSLTIKEKERLKPVNLKYRQVYGETATVKLLNFLRANFTHDIIECTIKSIVNIPNDVCDAYGRIVGDIWVTIKGKELNLNHWLLENGWAFASIYNSMSPQEINQVIKASKKGKAINQNDIYTQFYPQKLNAFDFNLTYRKPSLNSVPAIQKENGKALLPKLYRRLCAYSIFIKGGINLGSFLNYLKNKNDKGFYFINDFLNKNNHDPKKPNELKKGFTQQYYNHIKNNTFVVDPTEMVIIEDGSTLYDAAGKQIKKF